MRNHLYRNDACCDCERVEPNAISKSYGGNVNRRAVFIKYRKQVIERAAAAAVIAQHYCGIIYPVIIEVAKGDQIVQSPNFRTPAKYAVL